MENVVTYVPLHTGRRFGLIDVQKTSWTYAMNNAKIVRNFRPTAIDVVLVSL